MILANDTFVSQIGIQVRVIKLISDFGGQGTVFKVLYGNSEKALKVYKRILSDNGEFKRNLQQKLNIKVPDPHFMWPIDVVEKIIVSDEIGQFESYGYIMDLYPDKFEPIKKFNNKTVSFGSDYIRLVALRHLCTAFKRLHNRGLCYQDINADNIIINPETGDIRIGDTDNIAAENVHVFVDGTPRYMAPEIVRDIDNPQRRFMANSRTDDYSLAVLLFMLLFRAHPLEGNDFFTRPPVYDEYVARYYYGIKPTYIFDHLLNPKDYYSGSERQKHYNGPKPVTVAGHRALYVMFLKSPQYLLDAFASSFSRGSLEGDQKAIAKRTRDTQWEDIILQLQAQAFNCPHCKQTIYEKHDMDKCPFCKNTITRSRRIKLGGVSYTARLEPERIIAHRHFGPSNQDISAVPVLWLGYDEKNGLVFQNVSGNQLTVTYKNKSAIMEDNMTIRPISGFVISNGSGSIIIE